MTPQPEPPRSVLVIDTDPGIDDVVSLAFAARSPEVKVAAVTTTYGNAPLVETTRNARHVLALSGRSDVPVFPGCDRPLARSLSTAPAMHGPTGVGRAPVPPAPAVSAHPLALLDVLHGLDGPATLVTLGPLTNLARALERDSALVKARVERHLGMFGALAARGTAHRLADFNAWSDPEAAMLVLAAALPSTMVPLDVTRRFALSTARIARLAGANDPLAAWLGTALEFYLEAQRRTHGAEACVVHDVVPLGEALAPGLVSVEARSIEVGLDDGEHRGHTREHPRGAATHVATGLDAARLHGMLDRALGVM